MTALRERIRGAPAALWICGLCALGLVATTRGSTAVAPQTWGLWALGAWVVAFASFVRLRAGGRWRAGVAAVFVVGIGLVGAQDLFRPVLTHSHDIHHHAWGFYAVWRTLLDAYGLPTWTPYLGVGMPLISLYSPLSFALGLPAQLAGASPVDTFRWVLILVQIGSAWSAYGALRWLGTDRAAGLAGAVAVVLGPYHLFDQTARGALGECVAFAVAPLFLAAAWKLLASDDRKAPWIFASASCLLLLAHALSLIVCLLALALLAPLAWWHGRTLDAGVHRRRLRRFVLAAILALGVGAGWWLPLFFDLPHLAVESFTPDAAGFAEYSTTLTEPWVRRAWPGYRVRTPWSRGGQPHLSIPQYFGWGLTALSLLAVWGRRRDAEAPPARDVARDVARDETARGNLPPAWPWAVLAFLLVVAAMRPVAPWVGELPGVSTLIFPTRLHLPATVAAALAGGLALARLRRPWWTVAFVALLAWDAVPYLGSPALLPPLAERGMVHLVDGEAVALDEVPRDRFVRVEEAFLPPADYGMRVGNLRRVYGEYQPREMWDAYFSRWYLAPEERRLSESLGVELRFSPDHRRPLALDPGPYARLVLADGGEQALEARRRGASIHVELPAGSAGGRIELAEMSYPGWRLRLDGSPPRNLERRAGEPLLSAEVAAGARVAIFSYDHFAPWYRNLAMWISLGSALVLSAGLVWTSKPVQEGRASLTSTQPTTESSS